MRLPRRKVFQVAALLGAIHLLAASLLAQPATINTASAQADSGPRRPLESKSPLPPLPPLLPPVAPISFFRELLAMNGAERALALTNRPPQIQKLILAKVAEYESLNADERALRLRVTELRWYLRPLMTTPATNRPDQLAAIPEQDRKLVEDRLEEWDKLSPDVQKELLANEATMRYLADIEGRTVDNRRLTFDAIPPSGRARLEEGIDKWSSMTENQRRRMLNRFRQFFELTAQEKQKALNTLSEPERAQIEKTLEKFDNLSPNTRDQCIRSFEKFAGLSPAERQQFLQSAERWKLMSPSEREAWREVVLRLPPPPPRLPPMPPMPPRMPPLPAPPHPNAPVPALATNRN